MACSVQGEWLQTSLTGSTYKVVAVPDGYAPGDEVSSSPSSCVLLTLTTSSIFFPPPLVLTCDVEES